MDPHILQKKLVEEKFQPKVPLTPESSFDEQLEGASDFYDTPPVMSTTDEASAHSNMNSMPTIAGVQPQSQSSPLTKPSQKLTEDHAAGGDAADAMQQTSHHGSSADGPLTLSSNSVALSDSSQFEGTYPRQESVTNDAYTNVPHKSADADARSERSDVTIPGTGSLDDFIATASQAQAGAAEAKATTSTDTLRASRMITTSDSSDAHTVNESELEAHAANSVTLHDTTDGSQVAESRSGQSGSRDQDSKDDEEIVGNGVETGSYYEGSETEGEDEGGSSDTSDDETLPPTSAEHSVDVVATTSGQESVQSSDAAFVQAAVANRDDPEAEFAMESDPELNTDSDDDDDNFEALDPRSLARMLMQEDSGIDDTRTNKSAAPVTEIPVQKPDVEITADMELIELGFAENIVENQVLIRGAKSGIENVLDAGTVLCLQDRKVVGVIEDVLSKVEQPRYVLAFNTKQEITDAGISRETKLYFTPRHAHYLMTAQLRKVKGSDASNFHDQEIGDDERDFSDDEKEREFKQKKRIARLTARGVEPDAIVKRKGGRGRPKPFNRGPGPRGFQRRPSQLGHQLRYDADAGATNGGSPPVHIQYEDDDNDYTRLRRPSNGAGPPLPPKPNFNRGGAEGERRYGGRGRGGNGGHGAYGGKHDFKGGPQPYNPYDVSAGQQPLQPTTYPPYAHPPSSTPSQPTTSAPWPPTPIAPSPSSNSYAGYAQNPWVPPQPIHWQPGAYVNPNFATNQANTNATSSVPAYGQQYSPSAGYGGAYQAGIPQHGHNGTSPYGGYENGNYPNGNYQHGNYQNGSYQNNNYQNGRDRRGSYYGGTFQNGTPQNGTPQHGNYQNGSMQGAYGTAGAATAYSAGYNGAYGYNYNGAAQGGSSATNAGGYGGYYTNGYNTSQPQHQTYGNNYPNGYNTQYPPQPTTQQQPNPTAAVPAPPPPYAAPTAEGYNPANPRFTR